jgi:hypothetical protein
VHITGMRRDIITLRMHNNFEITFRRKARFLG